MERPVPVQRSLMPTVCPTCGGEHYRTSRWCSGACKAADWRESRKRLGLPPRAHGPDSRTPEEGKRFASQGEKILARLWLGRATNTELARISLKYTGRISDLRKDYDIRMVGRDRVSGVTVYALFVDGEEV